MSRACFLCDENVPLALMAALRQQEPALDVLRVGDSGAPLAGTPDADLLIAAHTLGRVLVSLDRKSMPGHLAAHFAAGRHTAGVILLRNGFTLSRYVQEILNLWVAIPADQWLDRTMYVP